MTVESSCIRGMRCCDSEQQKICFVSTAESSAEKIDIFLGGAKMWNTHSFSPSLLTTEPAGSRYPSERSLPPLTIYSSPSRLSHWQMVHLFVLGKSSCVHNVIFIGVITDFASSYSLFLAAIRGCNRIPPVSNVEEFHQQCILHNSLTYFTRWRCN